MNDEATLENIKYLYVELLVENEKLKQENFKLKELIEDTRERVEKALSLINEEI